MAKDKSARDSITVNLGAKDSVVNADAVALSMTAILDLIDETQKALDADGELLIKARPFSEGSFEIPLDLILPAAAGMFAHPLFDMIVDVLRQYFEVRRLLRGAPPDVSPQGVIELEDGPQQLNSATERLLTSSRCGRSVAMAMERIAADPVVESFRLFRGTTRTPFVTVERVSFDSYTSYVDLMPLEAKRVVVNRESLSIASIVFEGKAAWQFNRQGVRIKARVDDESFRERVGQGLEVFSAGDRLEVDLEIQQELDPLTRDYLNKRYRILTVHGHTKRPEQRSLFEE